MSENETSDFRELLLGEFRDITQRLEARIDNLETRVDRMQTGNGQHSEPDDYMKWAMLAYVACMVLPDILRALRGLWNSQSLPSSE